MSLPPSLQSPAAASEHRSPHAWWNQPWPQRLVEVVEMMRTLSAQTDPQQLVQFYGERMSAIFPNDGRLSLSRRDLVYPWFRITRSDRHDRELNPWKHRERLPMFEGGLLGELIYTGEPRIIDDLQVEASDPAADYLEGTRSLVALPLFENGVSMNMVVLLRREPNGFAAERLPEHVWLSNLFGRATSNLVLSEELREAYEAVDRELKTVANIQRSLLPPQLPRTPGLEIGTHYQTSQRAGGDYFDFFELPDGKLGILIADVAGHGTPAAVMMAVLHAIAHGHPGIPSPPSRLLEFVNHRLATRYTPGHGTFVTAFYGIYDPANRSLVYSNAGHNPPRVRRGCGRGNTLLDRAVHLPLGIVPEERYSDATVTLEPNDQLTLYTDGITEARDEAGEMFGTDRLDAVLIDCQQTAGDSVRRINHAVDEFTRHTAPHDDRTLVILRVLPGG